MRAGPDADAALIDAGRRGDQAAFAHIIERYQRAVYAVAYATTRDPALADDVTQDTFVAAWRRLGDLRDGTRLGAWLCAIARNIARDVLRRRRFEQPGDPAEIADPATPFDALSDAQSERLVAIALDAVPATYREALVLFYVQERSVEEVAGALGISAHTTNKRLSRGRQYLAARVEQLVERTLTSRGPKRDLVACVLAAIGVLGSASHVDASPATAKGSIMPRLAFTSLLVATVGGAGLLAAAVTTSPAAPVSRAAPSTPVAATTASTPAKPAPPPPAVAAPPTAPPTPPAKSRPSPPPRLAAPATSTIPDCATVARHLAETLLYEFSSAKQLPPAKRDQFIQQRSRDVTKRCIDEHWSDDRRVCSMNATDSDDDIACREDTIGAADELEHLPAELQCDAVAQHLTDLATAPGAKFAIIEKKMAERGLPFDMKQVTVQVRTQSRDACERIPWSLRTRRCIAAAKTHDATITCW